MVATSNVRVLARVRPALPHEYQFEQAAEVLSATRVKLISTKQSYESSYDQVLPEGASQAAAYSCVRDSVPSLLAGYNNTVLAYGQTGTGKTFTMIGDQAMTLAQACTAPTDSSGHGIVPRAVHDLFAELARRRSMAAPATESDVKLVLSYLEIYNDRLYDLLQPYKRASSRDPSRIAISKTSLEVREDPMAGTHVPNLLYVDVQNSRQVLQLVAAGNCNRATAHTDRNQHSSRSHAILQFWLEQRPAAAAIAATNTSNASGAASAACVVVRSKLNFVDLAGSERWGKAHTEAESKTLVNELTSINNSLSALALVVAALTDHSAKHVPYRSSRLTHLLQDSLGGNCNTSLIVAVAPCIDSVEESMASLKFADRARNIANRAVVNSMHDTDTILAIKEREIQRLRALLATYTSAAGGPSAGPSHHQQWQQWAIAGDHAASTESQQGAPLLPPSPATPFAPTNGSTLLAASGRSDQQTLKNPGGNSSRSSNSPVRASASPTAAANPAGTLVTKVAEAAAAAAAADKAALEAELAAARAALELERNIRNALEGQLQEMSAAAQSQQEAAIATACATPAVAGSSSGSAGGVGYGTLSASLGLSQSAGTASASIRRVVGSRGSTRGSVVAAWPSLMDGSSPRQAATAAPRAPEPLKAVLHARAVPVKPQGNTQQQALQQGQQRAHIAQHQQQQQGEARMVKLGSAQRAKQHRPQAWINNWQSPTADSAATSKQHRSSSTDRAGPWTPTGKQAAAAAGGAAAAKQSSKNMHSKSLGDVYGAVRLKGVWPKTGAPAAAAAAGGSGVLASQCRATVAAGGYKGNGISAAGFNTARERHQAPAVLSPSHSCPATAADTEALQAVSGYTAQEMLHLPHLVPEPVSPTPNPLAAGAAVSKAAATPTARGRGRPLNAVPTSPLSQSSPSIMQAVRKAQASTADQSGAGRHSSKARKPQQQQQQQQKGFASSDANCGAGWGRSWLLQQMQQQHQQQQQQQGTDSALYTPVQAPLLPAAAKAAPGAPGCVASAVMPLATPSTSEFVPVSAGSEERPSMPDMQQDPAGSACSEQYSEDYEGQVDGQYSEDPSCDSPGDGSGEDAGLSGRQQTGTDSTAADSAFVRLTEVESDAEPWHGAGSNAQGSYVSMSAGSHESSSAGSATAAPAAAACNRSSSSAMPSTAAAAGRVSSAGSTGSASSAIGMSTAVARMSPAASISLGGSRVSNTRYSSAGSLNSVAVAASVGTSRSNSKCASQADQPLPAAGWGDGRVSSVGSSGRAAPEQAYVHSASSAVGTAAGHNAQSSRVASGSMHNTSSGGDMPLIAAAAQARSASAGSGMHMAGSYVYHVRSRGGSAAHRTASHTVQPAAGETAESVVQQQVQDEGPWVEMPSYNRPTSAADLEGDDQVQRHQHLGEDAAQTGKKAASGQADEITKVAEDLPSIQAVAADDCSEAKTLVDPTSTATDTGSECMYAESRLPEAAGGALHGGMTSSDDGAHACSELEQGEVAAGLLTHEADGCGSIANSSRWQHQQQQHAAEPEEATFGDDQVTAEEQVQQHQQLQFNGELSEEVSDSG